MRARAFRREPRNFQTWSVTSNRLQITVTVTDYIVIVIVTDYIFEKVIVM